MAEKRTEVRYALDDEVTLGAPGVKQQLCQVMDVSAHGLRLRYHGELLAGTPVKVRLDFLKPSHPGGTLAVSGEVMHSFAEPGGETYQTGIRLKFVDSQQETAFSNALSTLGNSL